MKTYVTLFLGAVILCISAACREPAATVSSNPPLASNAVNANASSGESEDLQKESEQVKKDLEELEKKLADANVESRETQRKIGRVRRQIDETGKRIR